MRAGGLGQVNMLLKFSTFVLISTLLAANAVALEERGATYLQESSGSASFTEYSGCGSPGDDNYFSHLR